MNTSHDNLLGGKVLLEQPSFGYRAAIDPVLLASLVPSPGGKVLDVGTGSGAAALCLAVRLPNVQVIGLELRPEMVALACNNVILNKLSDRVKMVVGDILYPPLIVKQAFDHVITNPPFLTAHGSNISPIEGRTIAHIEGKANLCTWLDFCLKRLRSGGILTLIHRADRLNEILICLNSQVGAISLFPLWPRVGRPAKRVLIQATKGSKASMRLLPGLILHDINGYTKEAEAILREGRELQL